VKVRYLHDIVERAGRRGLPLVVGTEMNAPGLRFVDDFEAPAMAPVRGAMLRGADVMLGHSAAVLASEPGYASDWARAHFPDVCERNAHFGARGEAWRRKVTAHPC
jgi:hypothetical protein